jgi:hypothetical protein
MTPTPAGSHNHLWWLIMAATILNGCAAASLLGIGIQGLQLAANSGAVIAASAQKDDKSADEANDFGVSNGTQTKKERKLHEQQCNELLLTAPPVIQLRGDTYGSTSWRQLHLGGSPDKPSWDVTLGGWHQLANLEQLDFSPPLPNTFEVGQPMFMPYAPAESQNSVEEDRLRSLTTNFGTPVGNFDWNGRLYDYVLVDRLPCFAVPG